MVLRKVLPPDLSAVWEYREEFLQTGDTMDGCSMLDRFTDPVHWYSHIRRMGSRKTCPSNWVPDHQFLAMRREDDLLVGMLDIRRSLDDACLMIYGHIGYSVRPSQRRNGYAVQMLSLSLDICRKWGLDRILICCDKQNVASSKTILRSGGVLETEIVHPGDGIVIQRYRIDLKK